MNSPVFLFFLASFVVLFLHWRSDRKTMEIDQRYNYFMLGLGIAIAVLIDSFSFFIVLMLLYILLWRFLPNERIIGMGDKQVLLWLVPSMVFLGKDWWVIIFLICFILLLFVEFVFKVVLNRGVIQEYRPGLPMLFWAFVIVVIGWFLWI